MTVYFQKIHPTPVHVKGVTAATLASYSWEDRVAVVTKFKKKLKGDLRSLQLAQCCFCRRQLSDDGTVHIEHFVDKSIYGDYTFEIQNLALACSTCNGAKNGYTLHISALLKKRAVRHGKAHSPRCPALASALTAGLPYPAIATSFRWVHPHLDNFSDHIELVRGWVYSRVTLKGYRTIRSAKLNQIAALEMRAAEERMAARGEDVMSALAAQFPELDDEDMRDAAAILAEKIRQHRLKST
jgi:5-methylcytosine-specific restriction endonuclease McrA